MPVTMQEYCTPGMRADCSQKIRRIHKGKTDTIPQGDSQHWIFDHLMM